MKVYSTKKGVAIAIAGALSCSLISASASAELAGNLTVVSKYVLRGITTTYGTSKPGAGNAGGDAPENDKPSLQGGLQYTHDSGLYVGAGFETLGYSYQSYTDTGTSVEYDAWGGYQGKVGDVSYKLGLTRYQYVPGFRSTALETMVGVSYKDFGLNAQTLLDDVVYGNKGDTYYTLTYNTTLPKDIGFNASLGYYTYNKSGPYVAASSQAVSSAFRHLILGVTYPFAKNITGGVTYIIGGKNRYDVSQDNQWVGSLSLGF